MAETKPKRRWFRFSLRTLFVLVAIIGVPLGWGAYQLNWIWQRHTALIWVTTQAEHWHEVPVSQRAWLGTPAPRSLRIFGEVGAEQISVVVDADQVDEKQQSLERLFPEAKILVMTPGPGYFDEHPKR
jgi:hypothetical protein